MKRYTLIILVFFLVSCSSFKKIYSDNRNSQENPDRFNGTAQHFKLFFIADNTLTGKKLLVRDINSKNIDSSVTYYNDIVKNGDIVAQVIEIENSNDIVIEIEKDKIVIPKFTFPIYRYVILKNGKTKNKYILNFTNRPSYW